MADKKITELTAAGALTGTEDVEVVQGGANVKTTTQDIANLGGGGGADASESVKGVVEEADQTETDAGTSVGGTGAILFVAPNKLAAWLTNVVLALVHTWVLKQTFTAAPRFSSANTSEFLKTDGSKDLISVAGAASSDIVTGTDTTQPVTAAAIKGFRDIQRLAVTISAGTLTLDLNSTLERYFDLTTTVSSNFIIALSNTGNVVQFGLTLRVTGTVAISMPTDTQMMRAETAAGRWVQGSPGVLTLVGVTASRFRLWFTYDGAKYLCEASDYFE